MNSTTSKTAQATLGYSPIPSDVLEKSCQHLCKWINDYLPQDVITNFPNDLIISNGHQIYKMIEFLTKKMIPGKAKIDVSLKKNDKVELLDKQYNELINTLKEQGAY